MPKELKEVILRKREGEKWGFRLVGGIDEMLVLKVEKVLGKGTPAGKAGLEDGDIIVEVGGHSAITLTHQQVVNIVKEHRSTLTFIVERGDHIVPNFSECFPRRDSVDVDSDQDSLSYYTEAMSRGLGSRLGSHQFTTVGKMKVKVPKYNSPGDLYSEDTMDEMISGVGNIDADKLDPDSPAYDKIKKKKAFDPKRSSVLEVLNDHMNGRFVVDKSQMIETRRENRGVPSSDDSKINHVVSKPSNLDSKQFNRGFQKSKSKLSIVDFKSSNVETYKNGQTKSKYEQSTLQYGSDSEIEDSSSYDFSSDDEYFAYDNLKSFKNTENVEELMGLGPEICMTKYFNNHQEAPLKITPSWYEEGTPKFQELGMIAKPNISDKKHNLGPEIYPDFNSKLSFKAEEYQNFISKSWDWEQNVPINLPASSKHNKPASPQQNKLSSYQQIIPTSSQQNKSANPQQNASSSYQQKKPASEQQNILVKQQQNKLATNQQNIQARNQQNEPRSPKQNMTQNIKPANRQQILAGCHQKHLSAGCKNNHENNPSSMQLNIPTSYLWNCGDLGPEIFKNKEAKTVEINQNSDQNLLFSLETSLFKKPSLTAGYKTTILSFPFQDLGPEVFLDRTYKNNITLGLGPELLTGSFWNQEIWNAQPAKCFHGVFFARKKNHKSSREYDPQFLSESECVIVGL